MLKERSRLIVSSLIFVLGVIAVAGTAAGQTFDFSELPPPDPQFVGFYGSSVALTPSGERAIVGAPRQGRAYVFNRTPGGLWELDSRLPVLAPSEDEFGSDVAISGDGMIALVAHPNAPCPGPPPPIPPPFNCGAAFVFVRQAGGWVQEARFGIEMITDYDFAFGWSVALSEDGSTALIGQLGNCSGVGCIGAAFAYRRSAGGTWSPEGVLRPSNLEVRSFGAFLDLSADGNTALIGALGTRCAGSFTCGSAYIFTRSSGAWSQQAELIPSDPQPLAFFGTVDLAVDGTSALIGASGGGADATPHPGAIYAFAQSGGVWTEVQKITGVSNGDRFGNALSLSSDGLSALVGAFSTDCTNGEDNCGAVYRLSRQGGIWSMPQHLRSFVPGDQGGSSVALSSDGRTGLVGAPGRACAAGAYCGMVFVLDALPAPEPGIPTASSLGLALLALLLAVSGAWVLARRRRSA